MFLSLAYLFFIGSLFGWVLEVLFRKFFSSSNPEHKWINPGFCTGPYVPLYGSGLCILYLLAYIGQVYNLTSTSQKIMLFAIMAASMTLIEYIAGIFLLKCMKLKLWDYSNCWGNIQGLICPLFSFFWALASAGYYFFIHPHILDALTWLSNNLAFSFVIGFFFGVFTIDVVYSANLVAKVKAFADENEVVVKFDALKAHIHSNQLELKEKTHFLFPFKSQITISEHLANAHNAVEKLKHKSKG